MATGFLLGEGVKGEKIIVFRGQGGVQYLSGWLLQSRKQTKDRRGRTKRRHRCTCLGIAENGQAPWPLAVKPFFYLYRLIE